MALHYVVSLQGLASTVIPGTSVTVTGSQPQLVFVSPGGSAGAVNLSPGNGTAGNSAGGSVNLTGGNSSLLDFSAASIGCSVNIKAGAGNGSGASGNVNITGGSGPTNNAGNVVLAGGNSTSNNGGTASLSGGVGGVSGNGGGATVYGGDGNQYGGAVSITGGTGANLDGGAVIITGGTASNTSGGNVTIQGGSGPSSSGGSVFIGPGSGTSNGQLILTSSLPYSVSNVGITIGSSGIGFYTTGPTSQPAGYGSPINPTKISSMNGLTAYANAQLSAMIVAIVRDLKAIGLLGA